MKYCETAEVILQWNNNNLMSCYYLLWRTVYIKDCCKNDHRHQWRTVMVIFLTFKVTSFSIILFKIFIPFKIQNNKTTPSFAFVSWKHMKLFFSSSYIFHCIFTVLSELFYFPFYVSEIQSLDIIYFINAVEDKTNNIENNTKLPTLINFIYLF
jgi:hypothetical protein